MAVVLAGHREDTAATRETQAYITAMQDAIGPLCFERPDAAHCDMVSSYLTHYGLAYPDIDHEHRFGTFQFDDSRIASSDASGNYRYNAYRPDWSKHPASAFNRVKTEYVKDNKITFSKIAK